MKQGFGTISTSGMMPDRPPHGDIRKNIMRHVLRYFRLFLPSKTYHASASILFV